MALSVLNNVTGNRDCVDDIAANSVLVSLLAPLYSSHTTGDTGQQLSTALNVLLALMGNTQLVKECLAYNGILCLLFVCCQQDEEVRKAACEVLCKMTSDKLMGPKV